MSIGSQPLFKPDPSSGSFDGADPRWARTESTGLAAATYSFDSVAEQPSCFSEQTDM